MEYRLDEIFELQMGKTPSRNCMEYWSQEKENKWISISDLTKSGKYIVETKEYISEKAVIDSGIALIPKNTVIMSFKLSIGKVAITGDDMYSNEAIMAFHDKKIIELHPSYVYYLLRAKKWTEGLNSAVLGMTLNKATLSKSTVYVHEKKKQNQIAEVLDKALQLIEYRKKQLQLLDTLVSARFVEMFGDVLCNSMKWEVAKLGEVAPIKQYTGEFEETVWLLNLDKIEAGTGRIIEELIVERKTIGNSTCTFDTSNVLYSKLRPYLNKVVIPNKKGYATTELLPFRPIETELLRDYFAFYLRNRKFVDMISEKVYGAKMPRVSTDFLRNLDIPLPPLSLQNQFADFVTQIEKSKLMVQRSLEEAQLLFDSLMQEYFG